MPQIQFKDVPIGGMFLDGDDHPIVWRKLNTDNAALLEKIVDEHSPGEESDVGRKASFFFDEPVEYPIPAERKLRVRTAILARVNELLELIEQDDH